MSCFFLFQIQGEISLLEEGDYSGDVAEVYDRKRRMANGMEFLQKPEIKKVTNLLDLFEISFTLVLEILIK